MAFPVVVGLNYGDEKVTFTDNQNGRALGTVGILPDGRRFRWAQAGAVALVAGNILQTKVTASNSSGVHGGSLRRDGPCAVVLTTLGSNQPGGRERSHGQRGSSRRSSANAAFARLTPRFPSRSFGQQVTLPRCSRIVSGGDRRNGQHG